MKSIFLFFLGLSILVASCVPSYQRLKSYDTAIDLRGSQILLVIDDHRAEAETFAKYGFDRKAERIAQRDQKVWDMYETAKSQFSYCPIVLRWQSDLEANPDSSFAYRVTVEPEMTYRGDHQEEVLVLVIRNQSGEEIRSPFPGRQEVGTALSKQNLGFAFSQLDRRLQQMLHQAATAKEKAL